MKQNVYGYIYVAANSFFEKDVYKIGYTMDSVEERLKQLYTTGVPEAFYLVIKRKVLNPKEVEKKLHDKLEEYRINPQREYFQCELDEILYELSVITSELWDDFIYEHMEFVKDTVNNLSGEYIERNYVSRFAFENKSLKEQIGESGCYFIKNDRLKYAPAVIDIDTIKVVTEVVLQHVRSIYPNGR